MNAVIQPFGPCPCGEPRCEPGTKLTRAGHLVGCRCFSCNGRRNKKAGQRTEARRHKRLGGVGGTPRDELAYSYSINVTTEDKHGQQIPASFRSFVVAKWTQDALFQANKKIPVGSDALPALFLDLGHGGNWLLAKVPAKGLR